MRRWAGGVNALTPVAGTRRSVQTSLRACNGSGRSLTRGPSPSPACARSGTARGTRRKPSGASGFPRGARRGDDAGVGELSLHEAPSRRVDHDRERADLALDRARHRASVISWLRQRGHTSFATIRWEDAETQRMVHAAGVEEEDLHMATREHRVDQGGGERQGGEQNGGREVQLRGFRSSCTLRWLPAGEQPPMRPRASLVNAAVEELAAHPGEWAHLTGVGPSLSGELRKRGAEVLVHSNGGGRELYAMMPGP